ncbi:hypothetical protein ACFVS2_25630 [Brevibacillus sp. NPDC058079]|uniref:DUF1281 family ferredoxin-like fold protein n=1 Tax=Brevibacillus sp. NPDC058079 TaxID=3346330 RepID=UPI0036E7E65C
MSSYYLNTLIVRGADVHLFLEACKGVTPKHEDMKESLTEKEFTFQGIVPVPVMVDGQKWQMLHWGTISDAKFVCIREEEESTVILFETDRNPPLMWLRKAIELFPQLDFELSYVEDREGMAGEFCCKKGVLEDICYERCKNEIQYQEFASGL